MAWRMNEDLFERACWNILGMLAVACIPKRLFWCAVKSLVGGFVHCKAPF